MTLEAGGFQTFEAYDVLIANLDRALTRRAPAEDAAEVLEAFPDGLTTAEVAQIMAEDKYPPDLDTAEDALIAAVGDGSARACRSGTTRCGCRRARRARQAARTGGAPAGAPHCIPTESSSTA